MKNLEDFYTRFASACSDLDELSRQLSSEGKAIDATRTSLLAQHENDAELFAAWDKRVGRLETIICDLPTRAELLSFMSEVRRKSDLEHAILEHLSKLSAVSVPPSTPLSPPPSPRPPPQPTSAPPLTARAIPPISRTTTATPPLFRRPFQ